MLAAILANGSAKQKTNIMFKNLFKKKNNYEPLDYELRKYFENNILCLKEIFSEIPLENRKVFLPITSDFPVKSNGSIESAIEVLIIVAEAMQINPNEIEIDFYEEGVTALSNTRNSSIILENDNESGLSSGQYHGKNENGKYEISVNVNNLNNPEALIATIAHELCHIKLLGENNIEVNDEYLTDLTAVFFGFGIFMANASFQFYQEENGWGYNTVGYLKHDEWAYSLALFAFLRNEDNPEWQNFLNPTVRKELKKCLAYMTENNEEIFKFTDKTE